MMTFENRDCTRGLLGLVGLFCALACGGGGAASDPADTSDVPSGDVVAGGAAGAGGDADLPNSGEINLDCPEVAPLDGTQAARGQCCHRVSNIDREALLDPNEPAALEYRVQYQATMNHPRTIGEATLVSVGIARADTEQQSTLFRFHGPRENGEPISGMGHTTIGGGRYNCDGTYSYFSDTMAPIRSGIEGRDNPARWSARAVPNIIDATQHGRERSTVPWADNINREPTYVPFLNASNWQLDWELVTQGFDIEAIDTEGAARDCIGSRSGSEWVAGGTYRVYTPMKPNDVEPIVTANNQTMCGLVAFGISPPDAGHKCFETARCEPGSAGCTWVKLPDSLCPETDAERSMWGCHIGAESNEGDADFPNGYPTSCTQDAPSTALDPDLGATSEGQCCDPLGQSATLPACNAWILRQAYVAAAAEITDDPSNELPQTCE